MSDGGVARLGLAIDSREAKTGRDVFVRSAEDIKAKARETVREVNYIEAAYLRAAAGIRMFAAATGITLGVRQLIAYADEWKSLTGQLRLVTKGYENQLSVEGKLFNMAQRTRQEYGAVVALYGRMARSAGELGISEDKLLRVTETVSKTLVVGGVNAQAAAGGLMQFGQALAAGALRGDELNSVMEQMPELAMQIAEGMGIAWSEFRKQAKEGNITSKAIIDALLKQSQVVDEKFAVMPVRVSEAFTVLRNEVMKYIGEADKATGVTGALSDLILFAAKNLDKLSAAMAVAGVVAVSKWLGPMGAALQQTITAQVKSVAVSEAHSKALIEDAAFTKRKAMADAEAAAATVKALEADRAHLVVLQQKSQMELRAANATLGRAASAPASGLAVLGGAQAGRELEARAAAAATASKAMKSMADNGQSLAKVNAALTAATRAQMVADTQAVVATRAHAAALVAQGLAARVTAGAMNLLKAAMAFFGGPWGIAIMAIVTAVYLLYNRFKSAKEAAAEYKQKLQEVVKAQTEFNAKAMEAVGNLEAQRRALASGGTESLKAEQRRQKIVKDATKEWDDYKEKISDAAVKNLKWQEAVSKGIPYAVELWSWTTKQVDADAKLVKETKAAEDAEDKQKETVKKLAEKHKDAVDAIKKYSDAQADSLALAIAYRLGDAQNIEQTQRALDLRQKITDATKGMSAEDARAVEQSIRAADAAQRRNEADKAAYELRERLRVQAEKVTIAVKLPPTKAPSSMQKREDAVAEQIQADMENAKRIGENVIRGIQTTWSDAWYDMFRGSLNGFKDFFRKVYDLFAKLLSDMIAAVLTSRLKNALASVVGGAFSKEGGFTLKSGADLSTVNQIGRLGVSGLAGAGIGYGVGYGTGSKAAGALGGAAGGAAMGYMIGGPWGAVVGGAAGAVAGLIGAGKKAKEAAKAMEEARKQFSLALDAYVQTAKGTSNAVTDALRANEATRQDLIKQANAAYGGKKNERKREQEMATVNQAAAQNAQRIKDEFKKSVDEQINALKGLGGLNDFNTVMKQYEENLKGLAAAGGDVSKAEELRRLQLQRLFGTMSDGEFARTLASMPPEFQAMAEAMRKAYQAGEDLNRVLTEQGQAILDELPIREARLRGDEREATLLEQQILKQKALDDAVKNGLNADQIARLSKVLDEEFAQALKNVEAELARAAKAFDDDLAVRALVAQGKNDDAERLRLQTQHENELNEARLRGVDDAKIATLKYVQALEDEALAKEQARKLAEATKALQDDLSVRFLAASGKDDEAAALRLRLQQEEEYRKAKEANISEDLLAKLLEVQKLEYDKQFGPGAKEAEAQAKQSQSAYAGVQFTEVSAGRLADAALRSERWLEKIEFNTRGLANVGTSSQAAGVQVNVQGTFTGTPQAVGQSVGDNVARVVDKRQGFYRADERRRRGSPEIT